MRPSTSRLLSRPAAPWALLAVSVLLSGCWLFDSAATRLNRQIESGDLTKALSTLEEKLADTPDDPAFNLLAIKARLALCLERSCYNEGAQPPLLVMLPKLAAHVTAPVVLKEDQPPLTLQGVLTHAVPAYAAAPSQPAAALALYANTPKALQPQTAEALFQPTLNALRKGDTETALKILGALGGQSQAEIPQSYTYTANLLAVLLKRQNPAADSNLIALRSTYTPALPTAAAALFPWTLMHNATNPSIAPLESLSLLPQQLQSLTLPNLLDTTATRNMAQELLTTSQNTAATAQWQQGSQATPAQTRLMLQQAALSLDPNQPQLWSSYLPTLVSFTLQAPSSTTQEMAEGFTFEASRITSSSAPQLVAHILPAVRKLADHPAVATPLLTFAGKLNLSKPQQLEFEKLSQDIILKAASLGDVSSTLLLAQTLPGVAQNNRHSVVPLLVNYIRQNLRDGHFEAATNTANLLTQTLQMDVEFAPLVLEEFTEDLKRRKITEQLDATTPDILLQEPQDATLDLGPLFAFMQQHFQDQPKVVSAQLTTLIAKAGGTYGQPNAMYRLGAHFPAGTLSPEQQQQWLGAALEQSLLLDTSLTAVQLAETATRLADLHPGLNLAPVMETALKRASNLEDQRTLWQNATPRVREVLRAIRPEFVQLMNGVDALAAGRLNSAALAFAEISQPEWRAEAQPFLEQFQQHLIGLSGIYIPVSGATTLKTAAIILAPQGLAAGGKLNLVSATFISRGGTLTESEPTAMRTNGMAVHRFEVALPYNFDTNTLALEDDRLARQPQGGSFAAVYGPLASLGLQTSENGTPLLTATTATGAHATFLRTLVDPTASLRPDGSYLIQTTLGKPEASTAAILPPGSLLTLRSEAGQQPAPAGTDTTGLVHKVEGTLRHPAAKTELIFEGLFDPSTLLTTFTFSYPLPVSGQPAQAAVRCQTLAGPITCGMHNLNSARQAYSALVTGMQTRESMATTASLRESENTRSSKRILETAATLPETAIPSATTVSDTTLLSPTSLLSPTATVSATSPMNETISDSENADIPPTEISPTTPPSSTEPVPGAFINNSGAKNSSPTLVGPEAEAEPGAFIDLTGRNNIPPTAP